MDREPTGEHKLFQTEVLLSGISHDCNPAPFQVIAFKKKGSKDEKEYVMVWALARDDDEAISQFREKYPVRDARIIGGGNMMLNLGTGSLYVWDKSATYGEEPDRAKTIALLQRESPLVFTTLTTPPDPEYLNRKKKSKEESEKEWMAARKMTYGANSAAGAEILRKAGEDPDRE